MLLKAAHLLVHDVHTLCLDLHAAELAAVLSRIELRLYFSYARRSHLSLSLNDQAVDLQAKAYSNRLVSSHRQQGNLTWHLLRRLLCSTPAKEQGLISEASDDDLITEFLHAMTWRSWSDLSKCLPIQRLIRLGRSPRRVKRDSLHGWRAAGGM